MIGNADGAEPDSPVSTSRYHRTAPIALMNADGTLPAGAVGPELLRKDPAAPYGVRLDVNAVDRAFRRVWNPKSVVLVEASDLLRADQYGGYATSAQKSLLLRQAIERTDQLVGSLLSQVDLHRDAVLVVSPAKPSSNSALTIAAVHAPGFDPGLLKSGTTRRAGFVSLVDISPTVLSVLGVSRPEEMEGRPMKMAGSGGTYADRVSFFVRSSADGLFRDRLVTITSTAVIVVTILFMIAAAFRILRRRWRVALQWAALVVIVLPLAMFFAAPIHFTDNGGTAALLGLRRRRDAPPRVALPARRPPRPARSVDGRAVGARRRPRRRPAHGHPSRVQRRVRVLGDRRHPVLGSRQPRVRAARSAAVILAGLLPWRIGHQRGVRGRDRHARRGARRDRVADLGRGLRVDARRDTGVRLVAWMLLGKRVRVRTIFGLDRHPARRGSGRRVHRPARPLGQRTHIGRFFEKVGNEGMVGFHDRPAPQGHGERRHTRIHRLALRRHRGGRVGAVPLVPVAPAPPGGARLTSPRCAPSPSGFAIVAGLGTLLNDSGIAIPGLMLSIAGAAIVYLTTADLEPASAPGPAPPRGARRRTRARAIAGHDLPDRPRLSQNGLVDLRRQALLVAVALVVALTTTACLGSGEDSTIGDCNIRAMRHLPGQLHAGRATRGCRPVGRGHDARGHEQHDARRRQPHRRDAHLDEPDRRRPHRRRPQQRRSASRHADGGQAHRRVPDRGGARRRQRTDARRHRQTRRSA